MNQRGFTLVEVLVALLIMVGASLALYFSQANSLNALRKSRNYNVVAMLLQKRMAQFEAEMRTKKLEEIEEAQAGDFGQDFPDYKWEIKTKPFSLPNLIPKQKSGEGLDVLTETIFKTMTEYFEKAVREVNVTVIYTHNSKTLKYSLSTIVTDYTKELPSGL